MTDSGNPIVSSLGLPEGTTLTVTGYPSTYEISSGSLTGFSAQSSDHFLIMSTGLVTDVRSENISGWQGTDVGFMGPGPNDDFLLLNFTLPRAAGESAIKFNFTFLSEEYPEFVGTDWNDYFSSRIDGVERALDIHGNVIDVNNNFFDPSLSTAGTMFDARTPTLQVVAALDDGQNTTNVQFEISDRRDAIYDSAVFISDLKFTQVQTVFVDFDGGTIDFGGKSGFSRNLFGADNVTLPHSLLTTAQQVDVINRLNNIYADFLVDFTNLDPSAGEYSTILVGGDSTDVPAWVGANPNDYGIAEQIDIGNTDRSDNAFVLIQHMYGTDLKPDLDFLTKTIAHEAGHLFGLRHINDPSQLMYKEDFVDLPSHATAIGGDAALTGGGGTQNSYDDLARALGLRNSSRLLTASTSVETTQKFISFDFDRALSNLTPTLHNVTVAAITPDGTVSSAQNMGSVGSTASVDAVVSTAGQEQILLMASTTPGGRFDIFAGLDAGSRPLNLQSMSIDDVGGELGMFPSDLSANAIGLSYLDQSSSMLSRVATASGSVFDVTSAAPTATAGGDALTGNGAANTLLGLAGSDTIAGGDGADTLFGGEGSDSLDGGEGADLLDGGAGIDTATYAGSPAGVQVNLGSDSAGSGGTAQGDRYSNVENLWGSGLSDTLTGSGGANILAGLNGGDHVDGGDGNDSLYGNAAEDTLLGGGGGDFLHGGVGSDSLLGGAGPDSLLGFWALEDISTSPPAAAALGEGSDTLAGEGASDILYGGLGDDRIWGDRQADFGTAMQLDDDGNDFIAGLGGDDSISGGAGSDTLYGNAGDDWIETFFGNNKVLGGSGSDTLTGGTGNDSLNGLWDLEVFTSGNHQDGLYDSGSADLISGYQGNDYIVGGNGNDTAYGGTGDDVLFGIWGDDELSGEAGDDILAGNYGSDVLSGGDGNDSLHAGRGSDSLTGGSGADMFYATSTGSHVITDFNLSEGDALVTLASAYVAMGAVWLEVRAPGGSTIFTLQGISELIDAEALFW